MKKLILILTSGLLLQSCANNTNDEQSTEEVSEPNKIEQLSWLLDSWELQTPGGTLSESWEIVSENELKGFSMMVSPQGDTFFTEHLRLVLKDGVLWYHPTISNENDGQEVSFKEKSMDGNKVVFENPEHDFPQRIVYERTSDSTVLAYIEGVKDGKEKREEYPYKKK